ncbi:GNAT family N-acetyltransferase [Phaeobacter sp. QD34_3]|uniref:GNAT family N-acetyltransferase n=1 Tax=unclassified Phaeobacter TaxID=2621772 RepID=UPI00237F1062|nr:MULTISPECIES: GNAT family N-acetyltransferase [unclassified Phaeobacter]MDE4132859.1 GNAT family N-acetyltransferase [Phaeobacter sp. QD34_3]MDE4136348.1 GNAT family N-acetyltransferase [Phaeobacter sp. QD34_24]
MASAPTPDDMAATHRVAFTQSRPWSTGEFTALLDSPLTFAIGDAHCFALVRVIADEAELLTIATHPDHQRQGLARQVMKDWQAQARTRGADQAFLEVAADNTPAQALYQSSGFATCGTRPGYYPRSGAAPVDAVLMKRSLR